LDKGSWTEVGQDKTGRQWLPSTEEVVRNVDRRGDRVFMPRTRVENCVECAGGDEGSAYQKTWVLPVPEPARRGGPKAESDLSVLRRGCKQAKPEGHDDGAQDLHVIARLEQGPDCCCTRSATSVMAPSPIWVSRRARSICLGRSGCLANTNRCALPCLACPPKSGKSSSMSRFESWKGSSGTGCCVDGGRSLNGHRD
jgi:hypothetical protein